MLGSSKYHCYGIPILLSSAAIATVFDKLHGVGRKYSPFSYRVNAMNSISLLANICLLWLNTRIASVLPSSTSKRLYIYIFLYIMLPLLCGCLLVYFLCICTKCAGSTSSASVPIYFILCKLNKLIVS